MNKLDELREQIEQKEFQRLLRFEPETIKEEEKTIELSVSSEFPVERWFGFEILDHNNNSIRWARLNDGAAVRDTHYGDQIGVILRAWIDGATKKLRVLMQFSKNTPRAVEIWKDVVDKIRRNVSIRYIVHKIVLEKEEGETATYRATDWEPIHVSFEPDAADPTVGVGRSAPASQGSSAASGVQDGIIPVKLDVTRDLDEQVKELNNSPELKSKLHIVLTNQRSNKMAEVILTEEEKRQLQDKQDKAIEKARNEGGETAAMAAKNISKMARDYAAELPGINLYDEALVFIEGKKSAEEFSNHILAKMKDPKATARPSRELGLTPAEKKKFSFARLIASADPALKVKADFEREVSEAWRDKNGFAKESHFSIPPDVLMRGFGSRDLTVGAPTAGGNLVGTQHMAGNFIELARNKTVVANMGAIVLDGLVGDIAIPTQTGASVVQWVGEDVAADQADPAFGQKTATPKTASANTAFSRKLLLQSSPSIDMLVEQDLIKVVAIARDSASLHGAGGTQPVGLVGVDGVGPVNGAGLNWPKVVDSEKLVQIANLDVATMGYITNPSVGALLKTREKVAGYPVFLMGEDRRLNGYRTEITNQAGAGYMHFGDWSQMVICEWGGVDVLIDPYTLATKGQIRVVIFISMDIVVRYAGAFVITSGIN